MNKFVATPKNHPDYQARSFYQQLLTLARILICLGVCIYSLKDVSSRAKGAYNNPEPGLNGADFLYFYSGGVLWNANQNPYDLNLFYSTNAKFGGEKATLITAIYYYLPPASVFFGLFARQDFRTAYNINWIMNVSLTLLAMVLLGVILSWYRPIRLQEITILSLFLNSIYGRTIILVGQISSLMFVVILLAFILSRYERWIGAGIMLALLIIKFTYLPLYAGYLLLRRHYRAFIICIAICFALCIVPLLLTQRPIAETFRDWTHMMQQATKDGTTNSPSPFQTDSIGMLNLEPLIYRIFNTQSLATSAINWLVIGLLVLYSAYLITHSKLTAQSKLLDFALVSMLSLMCVYHRGYDIFFTFPALLYLYVHAQQQVSGGARRIWIVFFILMLWLVMGPSDLPFRWISPDLQKTYLGRLIGPYHIWYNLVLLGTILWLKRQQVMQEKVIVPATVTNLVLADGHD